LGISQEKLNPNTQGGQELLGHELTHVVQQREGRVQPTKQGKGITVNDNPTLENEADVMGKKAVEGGEISVNNTASGVQRKKEEKEPGLISNETSSETSSETATTTEDEATSTADETVYYVSKSDANARVDTAPHDDFPEGKPIIPIGTKVKQIETYGSNRVKIQKWDDANQSWWTWNENVSAVVTLNDNELYTTFFDKVDTPVHDSPFVKAGEKKLEAKTKYKVLEKCSDSKNGDYFKVQKDGENNPAGWIKDYQNHLFNFNREDKLAAYKKWLEERYKEASEKTGNEQITFVQGILYQAEVASENLSKDPPVYPDIKTLDKNPSFSETENTSKNVTVPHDLISILRKFIEITEKKPPTVTEPATQNETASSDKTTNTQNTGESTTVTEPVATETAQDTDTSSGSTNTSADNNTDTGEAATNTTAESNRIVGGSRHSNIDWNSRLGVPQYRTQSDNLTVPEATCSYTSMAMTLERFGNSRNDVIKAIDSKLSENKENPDIEELWKEKGEEFLKKISADASSGYQKLRGNKGGLVGKEKELAKSFRKIGQMEDLIYFYKYLLSSSTSRIDTLSTYKDKLPEKINNPDYKDGDSGIISNRTDNLFSYKNSVKVYKKFELEHRNLIKKYLDQGGSIILSVNHKGESGSHIIHVQSIRADGIVVDDPYGSHAIDYRYGYSGDLFKGKNKTGSRSSYDYKNEVHTNKTETDYTKRDFTSEAAQNLETDESRGNSFLLKWEMIDDSKAGLINYIVFYEK
jgi:hypothetical protein